MVMALGDEPELIHTVVSYRTTARMTQLDTKVNEITDLCNAKGFGASCVTSYGEVHDTRGNHYKGLQTQMAGRVEA